MSQINVDTINEKTTGNGVNIPGHVVQIVEGTYSTQISTTSTSFVTGQLSASITPSNASNKILISTSLSGYAPNAVFLYATIYRGATNLGSGTENTVISYYAGGNTWFHSPMMYLDAPSTTSSTTYTVYYKASSGTVHLHSSKMGGSKIYLMEIAQ